MKPYYSIIMFVINPIAQERIGVGLILSKNKEFKVKFSKKRLGLAGNILGESKRFVKHIEHQIITKIDDLNVQGPNDTNELFELKGIIDNSYFNYLSKYSNNLIQFSEPKYIKDDNLNFDKLFSLLISNEYEAHEVSILKKGKATLKLLSNVEEKLIRRVAERVHTHLTITSKDVPTLYFNYELDCLGLNGDFVGAKSLPLDQSIQTLHNKTSEYFTLTNMLEYKYDKVSPKNNFFLISDEPSEIKSDEHKFWEKLRKLPKLILISSEQSDEIAQIIEDTEARKFLRV